MGLVPNLSPVPMALSNDCGPAAMLTALHQAGLDVSRERLLRVWDFYEGADRLDTPGHHARTLRRLGVSFYMRRRLDWEDLLDASKLGKAVVLLVPVRRLGWHWVTVCGVERRQRAAIISPGNGRLITRPWEIIKASWTDHAASCALRVNGLGYTVGEPAPFEHDAALERDMLRLAALAEGILSIAEPLAKKISSWFRKQVGRNIAWLSTCWL